MYAGVPARTSAPLMLEAMPARPKSVMGVLPGGAHFGMKPRERGSILGECLGKKFQCHDLAECQVFGAIHLTHASAARQGHNAVALCKDLPGGKAAAANGVRTRQGIAA